MKSKLNFANKIHLTIEGGSQSIEHESNERQSVKEAQ